MKKTMFLIFLSLFVNLLIAQENEYSTMFKIDSENLDTSQFKKVSIKKDNFTNIITIKSKRPSYSARFMPEIFITENVVVLKLNLNYHDSNWIFLKEATVMINGETKEYFPLNINKVVFSGNYVKENSYIIVDNEWLSFLNKIKTEKDEIEIRYQGEYQKDIKIHKLEIRQILLIMDVLKELEKIKT